ncbi:hypothetical protein Tco_0146132 [Tanacetum coccineum]
MWSQVPIVYEKRALWGISHWGRKHQQFYGFVVNRESARDVYSRYRIIAITKLKIVKWHNYKHLDWITIRRDDDKLYTFKEGDYKRLCLQDIEDMLLLLVQGKLKNLTIKERLALSVSLRMFTRSIDIKKRVEDLQLGIESYQKKLNLIKPDMYTSDLKRKTAYTAYSNPIGFIYQNKDKKNRLMRIDELHKVSDDTLNDVRSALDDILKRIWMEYLLQTVWRNVDRERGSTRLKGFDGTYVSGLSLIAAVMLRGTRDRIWKQFLVDVIFGHTYLGGDFLGIVVDFPNNLLYIWFIEDVVTKTEDPYWMISKRGQKTTRDNGLPDLFCMVKVQEDFKSWGSIEEACDCRMAQLQTLEWITIRRDDDKLYTFKEGDYNRLCLQDIKDMLLLLVQGKLTNLNIEERLALGVSLRMFTRSIVIKRGFIYQNHDKKNRLMRIDELHKFSDGTLNDVRSALDDI